MNEESRAFSIISSVRRDQTCLISLGKASTILLLEKLQLLQLDLKKSGWSQRSILASGTVCIAWRALVDLTCYVLD